MSLRSWKTEFFPRPVQRVPHSEVIPAALSKWRGLRKENLDRHGLLLVESVLSDGHDSLIISNSTCTLCYNYRCSECPISCKDAYERFCDCGDPEPMIGLLCFAFNSAPSAPVSTQLQPK